MAATRPLETLKGVFELPQMNQRRNFLRENKLSLRELERLTIKKNLTKQQEEQRKLQRQRTQHDMKQQMYVQRRNGEWRPAASQTHLKTTQTQAPPLRRSISKHIGIERCPSCCGSGNVMRTLYNNATLRNNSKPCNKEIQTDDIQDQEFLYEAIKKCTASIDFDNESKTESTAQSFRMPISYSEPNVSKRLEQKQMDNQQHFQHYQDAQQQQQMQHVQTQTPTQSSQESIATHQLQLTKQQKQPTTVTVTLSNGHAQQHHQQQQTQTQFIEKGKELSNHLSNLSLDYQPMEQQSAESFYDAQRPPMRATALQDKMPMQKRSPRVGSSMHTLGSRDDIRLPRYLEREKREQQEQRARELERDPNCPLGHIRLPENDRLQALYNAETKFQELVAELNHMPMTTETLRIRKRKVEIEKELAQLEAEIRFYSKPKVYVKQKAD